MLNGDLKGKALTALKDEVKQYENVFKQVTHKSEALYKQRRETAEQTIKACETYISALANSPKEFDKSVATFKTEYRRFAELAKAIEVEARKHEQVSGSVAGAGVATGAGVAAFAPTAAIAIATTFGTASTGAAISTLSGAAAANAALAWLGGGALAAGGGGMVAGNALLALAGPVGWAIGGFAVAGGALLLNQKNAEIAEKATEETVKIKAERQKLRVAEQEIDHLSQLTQQHANGVCLQLKTLTKEAPRDYHQFTQAQKETLGALINNIQSLSKLLNQKVA
jgi:hypothetical protein